jgi:hypothetical protein
MASLSYVPTAHASKPKLFVTVKITTDDGRVVKARATQGSTIELRKDGNAFGFTPIVKDESKGLVEFVVTHALTQGGDVPDNVPEEIERLKVEGKSSKATSTSPAFNLQVERIERTFDDKQQGSGYAKPNPLIDFKPARFVRESAGAPIQGGGYDAGAGICCVRCEDGFTACANCSVIIVGCGTCQAGDCKDGNPWWNTE